MRQIIFAIFMFIGTTAYASESSDYQLLYHQDANAKKLAGSMEKLMTAVREGRQIRLYMNLGFVEHTMDAGFLSIFEGSVYAQINDIQGQRPNRKTKEIELKPYTKHVGMYSTKSPYEIKWFSF